MESGILAGDDGILAISQIIQKPPSHITSRFSFASLLFLLDALLFSFIFLFCSCCFSFNCDLTKLYANNTTAHLAKYFIGLIRRDLGTHVSRDHKADRTGWNLAHHDEPCNLEDVD